MYMKKDSKSVVWLSYTFNITDVDLMLMFSLSSVVKKYVILKYFTVLYDFLNMRCTHIQAYEIWVYG